MQHALHVSCLHVFTFHRFVASSCFTRPRWSRRWRPSFIVHPPLVPGAVDLQATAATSTAPHNRMTTILVWRPFFFIEFFVVWSFGDFININSCVGHTIFFVGPFSKIDQFATLRTEWPPRIGLILNRFSAGWAFAHNAKVRRK